MSGLNRRSEGEQFLSPLIPATPAGLLAAMVIATAATAIPLLPPPLSMVSCRRSGGAGFRMPTATWLRARREGRGP